jgi:protein SCO1/2
MRWQKLTLVLTVLLLGAIALLACGGKNATAPLHGGRLEPTKAASDFTLTDQNGKPFTLSSTRGKVVLLYFGYTSCPDVCPLTLSDMAAARKDLGPDADQVQVIFVTVDPERDSQQVLQKYVPAFDPTFIGVRGTPAEIKTVADAYGVKYKKTPLENSALGYAVDHSAFIYVIDRRGQLRELLPFGTQRQDIASDLKILINEGTSS